MTSDDALSPRQIVARYFEMWNTGDVSIASEILHPDWVDHAHPEVAGPDGVREAVEQLRAARPDLRFEIESILGEEDLVVAVGTVGQTAQDPSTRLVWLVRMKDGQMADLRTYRDISE
ncbi:nuclear transport factor 2 family protein [Actinomadura meridiana]